LERLSSNLIKIVLVLEYDGSHYCGFQFQENAATIQDEVEKALKQLTGESLRIMSASRTDTGVHALGQVVCFRTVSDLKTDNYVRGLNHFLPPDIAVKAAYQINIDFNVQTEACGRLYRYLILNSSTRSPIQRNYSYQVFGDLDIQAMNEACKLLLGEHDLASFVTDFSQSVIKTTIRTVYHARVEKKDEMVVFEIGAGSFLPHQVRNTVGTLIRVGQGKLSIDDFKRIMEARKPGLAGPTAPAMGLYLVKVNYPRPLGDYHEDL
jgi:tRNA pseudouridine38-40 synthase